jgi:hypothetical protein
VFLGAFTFGLALRIKEATYFTKSTNKRNPTTDICKDICTDISVVGSTNIYVPTDIFAHICCWVSFIGRFCEVGYLLYSEG